jgi:hypothetical protein
VEIWLSIHVLTVSNENEIHTAGTSQMTIRAKSVIYATHMPVNINAINLKSTPYRSYVLGVKLKADHYPDDLVYDLEEPYHYFRTHTFDGKNY